MIALVVLGLIALSAVSAPWVSDHVLHTDPARLVRRPDGRIATLQPPGPGYPLGTDELGRDTLTRLLYAGQVSLLVGVLVTTIGVTLRLRRAIEARSASEGLPSLALRASMAGQRPAPQTEGPAPAFILLGAWLGCYHFIYYDVLLAALPVALLFLDPRCYLRPSLLPRLTVPLVLGVLLLIMPNVWFFLPLEWRPPMQIPWDQYLLVVLWLWCGWSWDRQVKTGWTGVGAPR